MSNKKRKKITDRLFKTVSHEIDRIKQAFKDSVNKNPWEGEK